MGNFSKATLSFLLKFHNTFSQPDSKIELSGLESQSRLFRCAKLIFHWSTQVRSEARNKSIRNLLQRTVELKRLICTLGPVQSAIFLIVLFLFWGGVDGLHENAKSIPNANRNRATVCLLFLSFSFPRMVLRRKSRLIVRNCKSTLFCFVWSLPSFGTLCSCKHDSLGKKATKTNKFLF